MSSDVAIQIENLSKYYKLYDKPIDRLKESLNPFGKKYHHEFYALNDISFEIKRGETVGIIGKNGSGKSTLLKIITGIVTPSAGTVNVKGKIAALLELGAGFNPEFTGIENIYMNGTIMGYTRVEMDNKIDDIVAFADIGDFIRQPVKMYSSGMFARLAFAVNANVNPDLLIVDEALAVGDMFFQAKCVDRMKRMMDEGVTILFVSHDTASVKSLCQRGILLRQGKMVLNSTADKAVEEYFRDKVKNEQRVIEPTQHAEIGVHSSVIPENDCFRDNHQFHERAQYQRIRNGKAEFVNVQLLDEAGIEVSQVEYGQLITLRMAIIIHEAIQEMLHVYHIRSTTGVDIVYADSNLENMNCSHLKSGDKYIIDWKFKARLMQGVYNIACGMSIPIDLTLSKVDFCDFVPCAVQFSVYTLNDKQLYGFVNWDNQVEITKCNV